jgi:hypothetical protein
MIKTAKQGDRFGNLNEHFANPIQSNPISIDKSYTLSHRHNPLLINLR